MVYEGGQHRRAFHIGRLSLVEGDARGHEGGGINGDAPLVTKAGFEFWLFGDGLGHARRLPFTCGRYRKLVRCKPGFPILGVFRLKGQPKRDGSIIVRSCKASQSPVNPIRDAILAVNHVSCPSLSSSGPRQWGESVLKTSRLPGALSLLTRSWLHSPSAWGRR